MQFPWPSHLKPLLLACKHATTIPQIHALILTTGLFFSDPNFTTHLIISYARIDRINFARQLFEKLPRRTVNAWNSMIISYSRSNCPYEVLNLYNRMISEGIKPDSSTFTVALKACSSLAELKLGEIIWRQAMDFGYGFDVFVGSSVLNLYAKCGKLDEARIVFDKMVKKDVVSWSTMITGFAHSGRPLDAMDFYRRMQKEGIGVDCVVMIGLVQACSDLGDPKLGLSVHGYMVRREMNMNNAIQTSLIDMYSKNGNMELASHLFELMPYKNVISWGALITGFAQNGFADKALELLVEMQSFEFKPDLASLLSSLLACSQVGNLKLGKTLHGYIVRRLYLDQVSATALIDMYAKCGELSCARFLFDRTESTDLILWNAMISSYGVHGNGQEALLLFVKMRETSINPDHATFASLLSALSHSGLVQEGQYCFHVMINEYEIQPREKHYACMVDLLSRAGRVEEAYQLIESMQIEPGLAIWVALLSGCLNYRKLLIGEIAAKKILDSNSDDLGVYVLVSNFFSMAKKWDESAFLRKMMKKTGMKKVPGCSAVEVNGNYQAFLMEDKNHMHYHNIIELLDILDYEMRAIRYVPEIEWMFQAIDEIPC